MRWPWRRTRPRCEMPATDVREATRAVHKAETSLAKARARTGEIREVTARAKQYSRVNHFAELIGDAFRGGR